jgi:HEPN domain-containing protein
MSSSEPKLRNDAYGWIDRAAEDLLKASRELVDKGEAARVSDEAVAQLLTAAIRLYVAKADGEERTFRPIAGVKDEELTPTEVLSAVSELLRAMHLGPMELALWYRRRPDQD